jgi:hypothetical protein
MLAIPYIFLIFLNWPIQLEKAKEKCVIRINCKSYYDDSLKKKIYTEVTKEASFPGGKTEQIRFLSKHVRYRDEQIDSGNLQTTVWVKFIVETDGSIRNYMLNGRKEKDELTSFELEILRVIKQMPKWNPAKCNGKLVPAEVTFPFIVDVNQNN